MQEYIKPINITNIMFYVIQVDWKYLAIFYLAYKIITILYAKWIKPVKNQVFIAKNVIENKGIRGQIDIHGLSRVKQGWMNKTSSCFYNQFCKNINSVKNFFI